jgi:hypothetical protein
MADEDKKEKKPDEAKEEKKPDEVKEEKETVKDIDADSIIDAFLEENPDLVDVPVDEWPKEAIEMLKETFNSENIDAPNGVLPDEETEEGEPTGAEEPPAEGLDFSTPDEGMDFDIAELAKLVQEGDKDGAWGMLQNMFGVSSVEEPASTNALGRMSADANGTGNTNALAKLIAELKF